MYAQFALVIAATALLSADQRRDAEADAVRAVAAPAGAAGAAQLSSIAASTRSTTGSSAAMPADRPHGRAQRPDGRSSRSILIGVAGYGLSRVPTGFLPIEDQGYLLVAVQLPDGASLERTQQALDQVSEIAAQDARRRAGGHHRRHLGARQQRRASPMPASPIVILKDWSERGTRRGPAARSSSA